MGFEWIISHGDCDGVCSAALALACSPGARVFFSHPAGLVKDLGQVEGGSVMICDIAISKNFVDQLVPQLRRLSETAALCYVDHHRFPNGIRGAAKNVEFIIGEEGRSSSELVWTFLRDRLPESMSRVMIYGAIADFSDGTSAVQEAADSWDKREVFFESGILVEALEGSRKRDYDFKRGVVQLLSKNLAPSSSEDLVDVALRERAFGEAMREVVFDRTKVEGKVAYVIDVGWSLGKAATYARVRGNSLVGVAGESRNEVVDVSLRGSGLVDAGTLAEVVSSNVGGSGGGHARAAGARIPAGSFDRFVRDLAAKLDGLGR
ncbi:MAG: phosphoesterase [Candidatus Brockarchaeota archaeon]|nr:phosphoesterase [Candidatus Brockarchaeota archaeon]